MSVLDRDQMFLLCKPPLLLAGALGMNGLCFSFRYAADSYFLGASDFLDLYRFSSK